jgi:acetyl-CoA carboxylase beta subunit
MRKEEFPFHVKVCKNCGEIAMAKELGTNKDVCPICDSRDFEERVIDKNTKIHCTYCKKENTVEEILKQWITIPFFNARDLSYYCGCRGWD